MRAILPLVALLAGLAACESPTAPKLNPQPLPPGLHLATSGLNPQPLAPGRHFSATTTSACSAAATLRTSTTLYEPPDPCLR